MNHEVLKEKVHKAVGGRIPIAMRDRWADFIRNKKNEITLRYEWIHHPGFYKWVLDCPDVDFGEGSETITVWICRFGRVGHE